VLAKLKKALPYIIRYENAGAKSRSPHPELETIKVSIGAHNTTRKVLILIKSALGRAWQITVLPGYIIIYREKRKYKQGIII
jgi:hypothetical protein